MFRRSLAVLMVLALIAKALGEGTNFTVSIGGATVQIPVPESFVEVGTKNRMIPMVPGNRLLAWFAMPEDMKHFDSEPAHQLRRHIQVQVPKKSEDQELDADHFAMVATGIAKQQDQGHAKAAQEVNKILKQLSAPEKGGPPIRISEPKSLGSFLKTDEAVGFAMLMSVTANEQGLRSAHPIAVGAVAMRVKQKLLYVYAYSMAGSTASIDWVKSEAKAVAEAILKAN